MRAAEKALIRLRHSKALDHADWLWNLIRPAYDKLLSLLGRAGLVRVINGTDRILVPPCLRGLGEKYEPEVWKSLMSSVRQGDVVADVGAFVGLYTVALACRAGERGRVFAFEPDASNTALLRETVQLNGVSDRVQIISAAVGYELARVPFHSGRGSESVMTQSTSSDSSYVDCVTLDGIFATGRLDLLKIDVEGYEELVLRGAGLLLSDRSRRPRAIYIEVHPYAWEQCGTTSASLINLILSAGYLLQSLDGQPVARIESYGEVIARSAF